MDFPLKPKQQPNSGFACFTIIHMTARNGSLPPLVIYYYFTQLPEFKQVIFVPKPSATLLCYQVLRLNSTCSHSVQVKDNAIVTMLTFTCFTQPPPWNNTLHTHRNATWNTPSLSSVLVMRRGDSSGNKRKWLLVISHLWYKQLCSSSNLSDGFPDSWDILAPRGHWLHATLIVQQWKRKNWSKNRHICYENGDETQVVFIYFHWRMACGLSF